MLPTVDFFGHSVTRMIIGDNPVHGYSYIEELVPGAEMNEYYTLEKTVEMMFMAEECGFNTLLPLGSPKEQEILRAYRAQGGKMNFIFQPCQQIELEEGIEQMMKLDPIAIYHQGTILDRLAQANDVEQILKNMELLHTTGLPIGLCSHEPQTILRSERENWGADFYMTCLYNPHVKRAEPSGFFPGEIKTQMVFYPGDQFEMFKVIQQVQKPCIAYKVLAGGQVFLKKQPHEYAETAEFYFRQAFENIKPGDLTCVGVFQRDTNQLAANAQMVQRILG